MSKTFWVLERAGQYIALETHETPQGGFYRVPSWTGDVKEARHWPTQLMADADRRSLGHPFHFADAIEHAWIGSDEYADGLAALASPPPIKEVETFQARVRPWLLECFGEMIAGDREERNHRFLEEALELVQSLGCERSEAHQLVDYVYGRPVGKPSQEVGGVAVTLAALCLANGLDMHEAGEIELARIWTKVEQIRAKQAAKPKHSPLPIASPPPSPSDWRPIETAPRDERILLYDDGAYYAGWWADEAWAADCGQPIVQPPEPTHWQPLPAPPTNGER